jgi:hypothetical protein
MDCDRFAFPDAGVSLAYQVRVVLKVSLALSAQFITVHFYNQMCSMKWGFVIENTILTA